MSSVTATKENFAELVNNSSVMLVDFWAEWCGPCKRFGPIFEAVSAEYPDYTFAKVDTEAQQELAQGAGIKSIPTIFAIKEGVIVESVSGAIGPDELKSLIDRTAAVDVASFKK